MAMLRQYLLRALVQVSFGLHNRTFPRGFLFGAATSAYQIEGGWNAGGKGLSTWDKFTHDHPDIAVDRSNGDVACDSYHQWRQDVQIAHNMGLDFYRFSISWTRLLPEGFSNVISKDGVNYYNNLINGLLQKNIQPFITLYHWDLPQRLQDLGGWTNPLIADWFAEYAGVVFKLFADRVHKWITINEPNIMCDYNYNTGILPPLVKDPDMATYLCNKHVLLAHAKAWRLYDTQYKPKYHGIMSIANHVVWMQPSTSADEEASKLGRQHAIGRYAHPIYSKEGGWPSDVVKGIAEYSKQRGFANSILPPFTREELLLVKGTYDYFAINYYTSRLVRRARPGDAPGVFFDTGVPELGLVLERDPEWPIGGQQFIPVYPQGLRFLIAWIRKEYGDQNFFISESGYADTTAELDDDSRVEYYKLHLEQVLHSIHEDGANITGFTVWSLMDNFEWMSGYTLKFGLHHVDFKDPKRKRTPRNSAHFFADVIRARALHPTVINKHFHKKKHIRSQPSSGNTNFTDSLLFCTVVLVHSTIIYKKIYLLNVASCLDKTFPPGFRFGAATAAYQIEGGWNACDKGESIWDRLIHSRPEVIAGRSTGDVACDSYHNWRRDVEMVQKMGLHFYRFSISWTRILPNAFPTKISESGKKYYNDLINYILEQGIEPVITIYHWDLPQKLQDLGGWTNPLITDWFADYARVVFSLFADRVKSWITINEPNLMCDLNYNSARFAPLIKEPEMAGLLCNKNVLVAHAKAWRIYDKEYKPIYHGKISIANQVLWIEAKTAGDEEIAELARQACTGQYAHPIYSKQGGWPPSVEEAMALYSKKAGYPRSKLPAFTKEEILLVRGTYDFFAVNYYTARLARRRRDGDGPAVWFATGHPDLEITLEVDPSWPVRGLSVSPSYPEGLRKNLAWLRKQYGDHEFFITENGCGDPELNDHVRMEYIKTHLEQILMSIKEDGANVTGYTYWTLMDNFEWKDGYEVKFGLYEVDFDDPKRTRRPRASAYYYSQVATARSLAVTPPKELLRHTDHSRPANRSSNTKDYAYVYLLVICLFNCLIRYSCLVSFSRGVRQFPPGFRFGSASAAYQVEGAWNVSDKGESVWDRYAHDHPDIVINGNGDVATDSYHLWKEDVRIAKELGLHFYRFSISWTRIMPSGFPTTISETGRKYYSNLIDGLLESGVEPVVTLYHWDLPQKLQDLGGWTNPLIADWFADYAKVVFSFYADRVKTWITINEPILICDGTYNMQFTAPRIKEPELAPYLCNKHTLIAHAKAWRIYDTEYRHKYHGKVSLTNNLVWMEPFAPMYKDLTELALQHCIGRYAHPIFSNRGGWPPTIEKALAEYSRKQGHVRSRLPAFTKEEIHLIRGTYDFFAMNIYSCRLVRPSLPGDGPRVWFVTGSPELNITLVTDPKWKVGAISIMPAYPKGIRRHIAWLRREYGADLPILITENGYASFKRDLADTDRIEYLKEHLEQVLLSINEDGANVTGYSVWSLTDNFEWMAGYSSRFGLYDVDFEDPRRKRTPRASAHFYADLIKTRRLDTPIHTRISRVRSERHGRRTNSANSCHGLGIVAMILIQITGTVIAN